MCGKATVAHSLLSVYVWRRAAWSVGKGMIVGEGQNWCCHVCIYGRQTLFETLKVVDDSKGLARVDGRYSSQVVIERLKTQLCLSWYKACPMLDKCLWLVPDFLVFCMGSVADRQTCRVNLYLLLGSSGFLHVSNLSIIYQLRITLMVKWFIMNEGSLSELTALARDHRRIV